jgi:hypothetical protein
MLIGLIALRSFKSGHLGEIQPVRGVQVLDKLSGLWRLKSLMLKSLMLKSLEMIAAQPRAEVHFRYCVGCGPFSSISRFQIAPSRV